MTGSEIWDPDRLVASAIDQIVLDFGPRALSNERTLENRLSDLLPGGVSPRERNLVLAASRHEVPDVLQQAVSEGLAPATAVRYASERLHEVEAFEPSACEWVTRAFAKALGLLKEP